MSEGEDFSNGLSIDEGYALMINDLGKKYDTIDNLVTVLNKDYGYKIDINDFSDNEMLFLLDFAYCRGIGLVKRPELKAE